MDGSMAENKKKNKNGAVSGVSLVSGRFFQWLNIKACHNHCLRRRQSTDINVAIVALF